MVAKLLATMLLFCSISHCNKINDLKLKVENMETDMRVIKMEVNDLKIHQKSG